MSDFVRWFLGLKTKPIDVSEPVKKLIEEMKRTKEEIHEEIKDIYKEIPVQTHSLASQPKPKKTGAYDDVTDINYNKFRSDYKIPEGIDIVVNVGNLDDFEMIRFNKLLKRLKASLTEGHFDLCAVTQLYGFIWGKGEYSYHRTEAYRKLSALHCQDYVDMPLHIRKQVVPLVNELLTRNTIKAQEVQEVEPEQLSFENTPK